MSSTFVRAFLAAFLIVFAITSGALAQMDPASSLAPQDGLSISIPSPLDAIPQRPDTLAPVSPGSETKTVLSLSAVYFEGSDAISSGLRWRVFADQPDVNGNHALVYESNDAKPIITFDPGGYIVHASYGLASATRHVVLGTEALSEAIALNVGALRFSGAIGDKKIPDTDLTFQIHRQDGTTEELIGEVKAGEVLRLKAGSYQITSSYGQANAKVISEIRVEPGKLTEASVMHKAGSIDVRLLSLNGAEIADAEWSILTPAGDIVIETLATLKNIILAEGEYVAIARHQGQTYQREFEVKSGRALAVDVSEATPANPAALPQLKGP